MVESSVGGALVPSVMSEGKSSGIVASETQPGMSEGVAGGGEVAIASAGIGEGGSGAVELDKEFLCPICMQVIKDAFLTSCGHSFCYMCIVTHLRNKSDCPCCGHYLTINQLYPNFLLDKLLKKTSARQIPKNASPVEHLRSSIQQFSFFLKSEFIISQCHLILYIFFVFLDMIAYYCLFFTIYFLLSHLYFSSCKATLTLNMAMQLSKVLYLYLLKTLASLLIDSKVSYMPCYLILRQGCEISLKDIDGLLSLLLEKKRKMEQEEAETNMQILLDFLQCLRKQKLDELNEVQNDLQNIKEDVNAVERHRIELYRAKERYSMKLQTHLNDPMSAKLSPSLDKHNSPFFSSVRTVSGATCSGNFQKKTEIKGQASSQGYQRKDGFSGADPQNAISLSGLSMARKRRVHVQFNDLQDCYLQKRRPGASQSQKHDERDANENREGYHAGLEDFQTVLSTFTRYSRLRVIAELRHGDLFHSANIVSSIEFDRDDELFATAGVSRRIKVFEFSTVVNEPSDVHLPVVEMPTRSKLSCLSWNKYAKNQIASSDYEGIVTVWDVTTQQSVMEYEEHEKRAWSVDFSRTEPTRLVSGSDDCKVKIWCTNQEASVLNIDMKANICCVKYNPGSNVHVAVGSADHHIHYYDLRNVRAPLHIFSGHRKAVSYVKFLSKNELASASTDSTLRLWDVKEHTPVRTFRGHTNEKNFVGLTVNNDYIACGSETNDVFVYHKAISKPVTWHRFGSSELEEGDDDGGSYFISAVCWKSDSTTTFPANNQGNVEVLSNSPTMLAANSQGTIKVLVLAA